MDDPTRPTPTFTDQWIAIRDQARTHAGPGHASGFPVSGGAAAAAGAEPPVTSLEPSETSENPSPVQDFLSREGTKESTEFDLDESSWCSRFRHSGWAPMRRKVFASLKRVGVTGSRLSSFSSCGASTWLQRSDIDPTRFRISGSNCNDRLCTPCANARSWRIQQALMNQFSPDGCLFITLTLCGKGESLVELVDRLYKSFKALRNHPTWSDRIQGGAAFIEIKWSDKAQRWHPHLHCVCDGGFVPQGEMSDAWRSITKDSYIVDIRRVRDAEKAAAYVCKYASKPLNTSFCNTPALLDEAVVALKGRRLCLCFGSWYGTPLSLAEDETLADDVVDAAGWSSYLPLETLLANAASGDEHAIDLIRSIGAEAKWRASLTSGP